MKNFFLNLWNRLEKASTSDTDSPGERRSKLTLVLIAILCSCITFILIALNYVFLEKLDFGMLMFLIILCIALSIYFFTKRFAVLVYPFLLMILCMPAIVQSSFGGYREAGDAIFWSILAPLGALMFQSVRKAGWWFLAFLILVLITLYFDDYLLQMTIPEIYENYIAAPGVNNSLDMIKELKLFKHKEYIITHGGHIITFSITIFFTMMYFVDAFQKEHDRAENLVLNLQATNSRLETTLEDLKSTQSQLVQSEKMAALGQLTAGIVHEINNPIGAVSSSVDIAGRCLDHITAVVDKSETAAEIKDDRKYQKSVKILKENASISSEASRRISKIIDSLKSFTGLDEAEFRKMDIHEGLESTLTLIRHEMGDKIELTKEFGHIPKINCYPNQLNQVFMTLLSNAIKAIDAEGTIRIQTSAANKNVIIRISDSGKGIPPEELANLFDLSFGAKGSRVGMGMGLSNVSNIIQRHGGHIEVESKPGQGTEFIITLPV